MSTTARTAQCGRLSDGRWFFQHGPIDCVIGAEGEQRAVGQAVDAAWRRFGGLLDELMAELPLLRADLSAPDSLAVKPSGPVAGRMVEACRAHAANGRFITAMASVAGSVAQELIGFFERPGIQRAHVNNGGDIALHLTPGTWFDIGLATDPDSRRGLAGQFRIHAASPIRGVATSGWRGRSLSLGIADSVTVLAATAAQADAAATVIANAVNVDDARVQRVPAVRMRDGSDLGERLATCAVATLPAELVAQALAAGVAQADHEIAAGHVLAAALCLQGQVRLCGADLALAPPAVEGCAAPPGRTLSS
ncbi:UPF0280 family protein [soil metagenome]